MQVHIGFSSPVEMNPSDVASAIRKHFAAGGIIGNDLRVEVSQEGEIHFIVRSSRISEPVNIVIRPGFPGPEILLY